MTRPRRAARRMRRADLSDGTVLVIGVGAGIVMMLIGWAPTVDVPAPLPTAVIAGETPASGDNPESATAVLPADRRAAPPSAPSVRSPVAPPRANQLTITALGIHAPVDPVTVTGGALGIPDDPARVGRWIGGARLADGSGAVLLSGHVAWRGERGVLWGLAAAEPGTGIEVTDEAGRITRWQVTRVWAVPRGTPLPDLFSTAGPQRLYVVTCGGRVVDGHYSHNVIVQAMPQSAGG